MTVSRRFEPFCSTNGKLPLLPESKGGPGLWLHGCGGRFTDDAGRTWTDFDLCLGSVIWGHARGEIVEAITAELKKGGAPSIPSRIEAEAASVLLKRMSRYETVRFFKTGAEACTAAVRLSRSFSGRTRIISDGFHGWHDWGIGGAYPAENAHLGVPSDIANLTLTLCPSAGLNSALNMIDMVGHELAIVIVRPEAWSYESLSGLIGAAKSAGAITVCDEVTSHFKYSRSGSAGMLGAQPDMICIGKGMANGMPLSALLGPSDILNLSPVAKISSTNSSETASLAAMIAAEGLLEQASIWPSWSPDLDWVTGEVSQTIENLGLDTIEIVRRPGFFSIERASIPLRTDPLRFHLTAHLGARRIYTRGWFHGCDRHEAHDWLDLTEGLRAALHAWALRKDPIP